jgi:hypothetical protein
MRWFALYLPQFHEIEENNNWWGKGFTEWTHVNGAKPLYPGHHQPIKPLNDNYYNLMDKETVQWQTDLMKQYGIDGLVYYHYYFCGKKLLEKPAENLLKWKDIDQKFFFCWANHSWYQAKNGVKKLLLEQTYGDQSDWEAHFQYLLPFFQDSRYEKKDNKPVFMIFAPKFPEKNEMLGFFDARCKEVGFDGIYVIETFIDASSKENFNIFRENQSKHTQLTYIREPAVSYEILNRNRRKTAAMFAVRCMRKLSTLGILPWVEKINGNRIYRIMQKKAPRGEKMCHGLFFSWDNTPRHSVRGYVITPPSKEMVMEHAKSIRNDEYVIVNAWNEWAEGMVLEPTAHNGYKYLEWIRQFRECEKV